MNTQPHHQHPIRRITLGVVFAASIVAALPAQAGWFGNTVSTAKAKVAATPGNVKDKLEDISAKLNELFEQIEENRPLMQQVRNGQMMTTLKETMAFLGDMQQDYQQFASAGVGMFRHDIKGMFADFGDISQTFGHNGPIMQRLENAGNLIDKMPTAFLYVMNQAIGPQLETLQERIGQLRMNLSHLPVLPPLREVRAAPMNHTASLCPLVNDKPTKVTVAIIESSLKSISFVLKTIKDYMPSDLVVTANVVAGGGLTMSKHPVPMVLNVGSSVVDGLSLALEDYKTIAGAVCPD